MAAPARPRRRALAAGVTVGVVVLAGTVGMPQASAAQWAPDLGTAAHFAVLGGQTVTNTGPSVISGNLGVSPGTAITGFPPGLVIHGVEHSADATAASAESAVGGAWVDTKNRTPRTAVGADIGGRTLAPGVYHQGSGLGLTGTVTLDGHNDPASVFIFQAGSTLITASNSTVRLINGAQQCHVFWEVGSSATLGTGTTFVGTILALTSATLQTGASLAGRVLARNGAVTLDTNVITQPTCHIASKTTSSPSPGPTSTSGGDSTSAGGSTSGGGSTSAGGSTSSGSGGTDSGGDTSSYVGRNTIPLGHPNTGLGGATRLR